MKILLISLNREAEPFTAAPLGMALVASALKAAGHKVRALDLLFSEDADRDIADAIEGFSPGLVGVSLRNIESSTEFLLPAYREVIGHIKSLTRAPVVMGGPGFSIMPKQALDYLGLELGVVGEGERAAVELARAIDEGRDPAGIPGVSVRRAGTYVHIPQTRMEDLSKSHGPAWEMLPVHRYDMVGIQAKRGCSFGCVYCTYPSLEGRRLRLRTPEDVVRELGALSGEGEAPAFYFVDNVFNNPRSHAEGICRAIISSGIKVEWGCLASPLGLDVPLLELMQKAGCVSVEIGADSLSDRALAGLGKAFKAKDVADAVEATKATGMMGMVFLILGGPGEDKDTLRETFDALDALKPDKAFAVAGLRIYPGTPLRDIAVREGVIEPDDNLLIPMFYVSRAIGDALYGIAEGYFKARPGWIYYPAKGVLDGKKASIPAGDAVWDTDASVCLDKVLADVPRLLRPVVKRAIRKKAGALALTRERTSVSPIEVRDAFLSETPGPFMSGMKESLRRLGLING